jgi:hypothetical protein
MVKLVMGRVISGLLAALMLATPVGFALAAGEVKPLHVQTIEKYPAPKLDDVDGREYKALIDPARTKASMDEAFKDLWGQVKAAAAKRGFKVTEKDKNPLAIEFSTKEYFDTKDQALWNKGFIIRVTTRYKDGKPNEAVAITIKSIFEDAERSLAVPLAVVGVEKSKTEAEENVGFGPGGELRGYVEKGSSFSVPLSALGKLTLADFGKFMPELLKLGLPADTALVSSKAYSYRVRPGAVVLPGIEPCGVSMEAWSATEGGAPYLYDFSFGYGDIDFYAIAPTHTAGEQFMIQVIKGELGSLGGTDSDKWGGSKVRKMMNRPVPSQPAASALSGPKTATQETKDMKSSVSLAVGAVATAVALSTSAAPPVDPLDARFGVASQPAYIKHYEADKSGKVILNPYLQVGSKDFPVLLEVKSAPYNWVIDTDGNVVVVPEAAHPLGRVYAKGFFRPEDQSERKPGTRENFGHVSALGGAPGRISGEILYDPDTKSYIVNNKSGRYSKHNADRTPEQLAAAAVLIRSVVDSGTTPWGPVAYLLAYAPESVTSEAMKNPKLQYDDPKKKLRPHLIVMEGAPSSFKPDAPMPVAAAPAPKADKPAVAPVPVAAPAAAPVAAPVAPAASGSSAKAKKPKAAQNDDPS